MNGWLITNGFLNANKFNEINLWLLEAAKKLGIELEMKSNAQILPILDDNFSTGSIQDNNRPDFVLFWDKDIPLAKYLEMLGLPLFNNQYAIASCDDKSLTHLLLQKEGIKMPRTIIAPMTFSNIGYTNLDFLDMVENELKYPFVVKESFGSFGMQVHKVSSKEELEKIVQTIAGKPMIFQEFISNSNGRDIRLQVVGNQVVAAMYRYSDNGDFRANISNGGKMKPYDPTKEQIDMALASCKILGLDFAGVDILFGKNEEPILCEVNSNAHFKNIYDCTGVNIADAIMEYIIKKMVLIKK